MRIVSQFSSSYAPSRALCRQNSNRGWRWSVLRDACIWTLSSYRQPPTNSPPSQSPRLLLSLYFLSLIVSVACVYRMGSSQSSPADTARGEKVLERLNALQFNEKIRQQDEDGYVQVDATPSRYEGTETVSVATAEAWEKELLADPKVRGMDP